jgi:hypothetical protein
LATRPAIALAIVPEPMMLMVLMRKSPCLMRFR